METTVLRWSAGATRMGRIRSDDPGRVLPLPSPPPPPRLLYSTQYVR